MSRLKPAANEFISTRSTGLPTTDSYNWDDGADDDFFSNLKVGEMPAQYTSGL